MSQAHSGKINQRSIERVRSGDRVSVAARRPFTLGCTTYLFTEAIDKERVDIITYKMKHVQMIMRQYTNNTIIHCPHKRAACDAMVLGSLTRNSEGLRLWINEDNYDILSIQDLEKLILDLNIECLCDHFDRDLTKPEDRAHGLIARKKAFAENEEYIIGLELKDFCSKAD